MVLSLTVAVLAVSTCSQAVTIYRGLPLPKRRTPRSPEFLQLTTAEDTRVSVSVDDGTEIWERRFYDYATVHSVPLLGFKPGRTNEITVTAYDRQRNQVTAASPWYSSPIRLNLHHHAARLIRQANRAGLHALVIYKKRRSWYVTIVDSSGEVVWYSVAPFTADVRRSDNGDLFMPWTNHFVEMNLLGANGQLLARAHQPAINLHDGVPTDHGTILYLSTANEVVSNYPTSMTEPKAPLATATRSIRKSGGNLGRRRGGAQHVVTDQPAGSQADQLPHRTHGESVGWTRSTANAVIEDPRDDSLIVSMRHQNAVVKISRATGQLRWILGPPANWGPAWQPYLLKPVGTPFVWQYGQHSPILTPRAR